MSIKFPEEFAPQVDEIMEEVWAARAQLLEEHGGLHGLVKHLRNVESQEYKKLRVLPIFIPTNQAVSETPTGSK